MKKDPDVDIDLEKYVEHQEPDNSKDERMFKIKSGFILLVVFALSYLFYRGGT